MVNQTTTTTTTTTTTNNNNALHQIWSLAEGHAHRPAPAAPAPPYIYIYICTYMRNLLGWLETRLAQMTLDYLKLA